MSIKRTHDHADKELNKIKCPIITGSLVGSAPPIKKQCVDKSKDDVIVEEEKVIDEVFEENHEKRIQNALNLISEWGPCSAVQGKQWVLDQTVRLLCGGLHTSRSKGYNTQTVAYKEWVVSQNTRGQWNTGSLD